ncbi:hypothetical protein AGABI2DRAFT_143266 [Agaricus bisporus var. bisporus H97]|uniref:hypothetical protein n=1 Tax=Agaricus bisporus var. bisporus (strain H97 / ATCC MYA-4626 / FGSC 10389) TaxID=936046 RepID=UPI00029F5FB7|nr:hypothetical protein AGABI2DRAFT_143266 [Agaricus bisporus var. bisporus H97]EKV47690.1 hypothetical protein AGABI2DRAFT_143266 [Agaricus bisporus var. bisporus H97]
MPSITLVHNNNKYYCEVLEYKPTVSFNATSTIKRCLRGNKNIVVDEVSIMMTIRPYKSASLKYKRNRRLCLDTISSPSSHCRDGTPSDSIPPASDRFRELSKPRQPTIDRPIDRYPITRIVILNLTSTVVANGSQQSLTGSYLTQEILYDDKEEETFDRDLDTEPISSPRTQHHESLEKATGRHYLVNDLDRAVMLEYNILICESIMKTAGQQFSKESVRGLLSCDETEVWMSNRSQLINFVQNVCDAVRSLKPNAPFQTLQMLSNFLQDR